MDDRVARMRREYEAQGLIESEMADDPFSQFEEWFSGVLDVELYEPSTFILATSTSEGTPSARAVLMKDFSPDGLVFYTNLESRKSVEIMENPLVAATFVWTELHRQVRFEGRAEMVGGEEADAYFATRPRGAQLAAHASDQSRLVASRDVLDTRFERAEQELGTGEIGRPEKWGGWRIRPESVEFWQGQPDRFHDRVRYVRDGDGWLKERLAP